MSVHKDYEAMSDVALHYAKEHGVNYNVILVNPENGGMGRHSTYEMVTDSYFEKERPHVIVMHRTDDILKSTEDKAKSSGGVELVTLQRPELPEIKDLFLTNMIKTPKFYERTGSKYHK